MIVITGCAENAVHGGADLGPGMAVLTKPLEIPVLERRVRGLIDGR